MINERHRPTLPGSPTSMKVAEEVNFEIENYLQYKGDQFSEFFDANSYILMTKAMDDYVHNRDNMTLMPMEQKDEIGQLAESYKILIAKVGSA